CGVPAAFWIGSGIGAIPYRRFIFILNYPMAVYRGGKTTPTTGGGYNEFRNDDEPNTTK
ncbi:hypothetical protein Tco_1579871, partial [Tanacetum coccineum]